MWKHVVTFGTLVLVGCAAQGTTLSSLDLGHVEQAVAIAAAAWAVLKFVLTPLLAQMVRKAVNEDLSRLAALETQFTERGMRIELLEKQMEDHAAVFRELPLMRESVAATREAVSAVKESLDRVLDLVEEQQRSLGRLEGLNKE